MLTFILNFDSIECYICNFSLRSRFKLFTLKDRSPSDSSLEKIDHNVIEVSKHMEIVQQLRDDLAMEKEKAVNEAVLEVNFSKMVMTKNSIKKYFHRKKEAGKQNWNKN